MSDEVLYQALIDEDEWVTLSRTEYYLVKCCSGETGNGVTPLSRVERLLQQLTYTIAESGIVNGDTDSGNTGGTNIVYHAGDNISIDENNRISVLVADTAEKDNTRPITSAAVNTIVGNIDVLLSLI